MRPPTSEQSLLVVLNGVRVAGHLEMRCDDGVQVSREVAGSGWVQLEPSGGGASITLVTWFESMKPGCQQGLVLTTEDIDARLRIREIPPADHDLRTAVAAAGFETDPDGLRKATRLFSRVPGYRMYIGEVDDITVTTAVSIATGSGVGIFDVATPPEHRGHGYGAAITARAVRDGFTAGARFAWLQSSPEGFGVYERLGFQTVEEWGLWISG